MFSKITGVDPDRCVACNAPNPMHKKWCPHYRIEFPDYVDPEEKMREQSRQKPDNPERDVIHLKWPDTAGDILSKAAETYKERNALYGNNYKDFGLIMSGLFPNGVKLNTVDDYNRIGLFVQIISKFTRYARNWETGHQDSIHDAIVYSAMLEEVDAEINKRTDGRTMGK